IGLFLTERIPQGLPIEETVERIRAQGGLVYAPHPYAYARRPRWHAERSLAVADIVEVFNSRAFYPPWNRRALEAARARSLVAAASTDSHFGHELGRAYTEVPAFDGAAGLLRALARGTPVGIATASPFIHVASISLKAARLLVAPGRYAPDRERPPTTIEPLGADSPRASRHDQNAHRAIELVHERWQAGRHDPWAAVHAQVDAVDSRRHSQACLPDARARRRQLDRLPVREVSLHLDA